MSARPLNAAPRLPRAVVEQLELGDLPADLPSLPVADRVEWLRRLLPAREGDGPMIPLGESAWRGPLRQAPSPLPALPREGLPRESLPRVVPLPGRVQADSAGYIRVVPDTPPAEGGAPPETPLRDLEYVVVDVETTGGTTKRGHRVTEVAALRCGWDGRVLEEFSSLVNPERAIPPFISSLTNITWDMVAGAPLFQEIATEVARLLQGRVFVAHNAAFDWRFLSWELERATGTPPDGRVLCTVRQARKVVPEVGSRSLDALSYFFGLQNDARHRAYGDARVTAELLGRLMARLEEREVSTWEALEQLVGRRKARKPRKRQAMPMAMDVKEIPSQ